MSRTAERRTSETEGCAVCGREGEEVDVIGRREDEGGERG